MYIYERERERARVNRFLLQNAQRNDQSNFIQNLFKKPQQSVSSNKITLFYLY